jgi:hypothetical protein
MKWIFIILLLCNVLYFGYEFDRQTRITVSNSTAAIAIPRGTERLKLLTELDNPPEVKTARPEQPQSDHSSPEKVSGQKDDTRQVKAEKVVNNGNADTQMEVDTTSELLQTLPGLSMSNLNKEIDRGDPLCFTYGPLIDTAEYESLEDWFRSRDLWVNHRQTDEKGRQLFWIYLSSRENRANAVAAINDLKDKGVKDMRLISRGDMVNAISLGLYSTQAAVNRRLREIKSIGYKPIVVPHYGGKKIHWLDIRIDKKTPVLNEIIKGLPARYNSVPVKCSQIALAAVRP